MKTYLNKPMSTEKVWEEGVGIKIYGRRLRDAKIDVAHWLKQLHQRPHYLTVCQVK